MLAVSTDTDTGACTINHCSGAALAARATKHSRQSVFVRFMKAPDLDLVQCRMIPRRLGNGVRAIRKSMVPQPGFELGTHALRMRCSTN